MLNKLKKIYRYAKYTVIGLVIVLACVASCGAVMFACYTSGQMSACNVMLRNSPDQQDLGLYCERMKDGISVRSTVLKRTIFNVTRDSF